MGIFDALVFYLFHLDIHALNSATYFTMSNLKKKCKTRVRRTKVRRFIKDMQNFL